MGSVVKQGYLLPRYYQIFKSRIESKQAMEPNAIISGIGPVLGFDILDTSKPYFAITGSNSNDVSKVQRGIAIKIFGGYKNIQISESNISGRVVNSHITPDGLLSVDPVTLEFKNLIMDYSNLDTPQYIVVKAKHTYIGESVGEEVVPAISDFSAIRVTTLKDSDGKPATYHSLTSLDWETLKSQLNAEGFALDENKEVIIGIYVVGVTPEAVTKNPDFYIKYGKILPLIPYYHSWPPFKGFTMAVDERIEMLARVSIEHSDALAKVVNDPTNISELSKKLDAEVKKLKGITEGCILRPVTPHINDYNGSRPPEYPLWNQGKPIDMAVMGLFGVEDGDINNGTKYYLPLVNGNNSGGDGTSSVIEITPTKIAFRINQVNNIGTSWTSDKSKFKTSAESVRWHKCFNNSVLNEPSVHFAFNIHQAYLKSLRSPVIEHKNNPLRNKYFTGGVVPSYMCKDSSSDPITELEVMNLMKYIQEVIAHAIRNNNYISTDIIDHPSINIKGTVKLRFGVKGRTDTTDDKTWVEVPLPINSNISDIYYLNNTNSSEAVSDPKYILGLPERSSLWCPPLLTSSSGSSLATMRFASQMLVDGVSSRNSEFPDKTNLKQAMIKALSRLGINTSNIWVYHEYGDMSDTAISTLKPAGATELFLNWIMSDITIEIIVPPTYNG